jgi:hypothetical protein
MVAQLVKKFSAFMRLKGVHKSHPLKPFLSQLNPVHYLTLCFFKIHFNITLASTPSCLKWPPPLRFPYQNVCTFLVPLHATCPAYLTPWFIHSNNKLIVPIVKILNGVIFCSPILRSVPFIPLPCTSLSICDSSFWMTDRFHNHTIRQEQV